VGVDSRESLALPHQPVSARRSEGTHEGALLIGRRAWSLSLGGSSTVVGCNFILDLQDQIVSYFNPLITATPFSSSASRQRCLALMG
jgi:hypothetical protein